jgi:hypothetical protein
LVSHHRPCALHSLDVQAKRRGALHCAQALRSDLSGVGDQIEPDPCRTGTRRTTEEACLVDAIVAEPNMEFATQTG